MTPDRRKATTALVTCLLLVLGLASPAGAQPDPPDESGPITLDQLRANVEAATGAYIEAEAKLEASQAKQAQLQQELVLAQLDMARVQASVRMYAAEAYRTGRLGVLSLMLRATSQDDFLGRAVTLNKLTQYDQARLHEYLEAKDRTEVAKAAIDAEVALQASAKAEMEKVKKAAEKALAAAGGTPVRVDIDHSKLPTARPAPRNPDGTWPSESRTADDPTTGSKITPRTYHAVKETQRLGFNWYVSCYRANPPRYEHPKGRACDWATDPDSFRGTAKGDNKVYGDRLASFYVKNAKALGVMYVVWYCTIWLYGSGWRRYNSSGSRCGDAPANDHTNHVHLSVY